MTEAERRKQRKERQKGNKWSDRMGLRNAYDVVDPTPMTAINNILTRKTKAVGL